MSFFNVAKLNCIRTQKLKKKGFTKEGTVISHPRVDVERRKLLRKISLGVLNTKEKLVFCFFQQPVLFQNELIGL